MLAFAIVDILQVRAVKISRSAKILLSLNFLGGYMTWFYIKEVLQTQQFDTIIQTIMWVSLWIFVIIRLNRIEDKINESS